MKRGNPSPIQEVFPSLSFLYLAAAFLFAALSHLPAVGQDAAHGSATGQSAVVLPGIVVEEVGKGYPDRPVLQQGDILLSWSRGDSHGDFESPTYFWMLKTEQRPLGPVIVHGLRGGQAGEWILSENDFVTVARPNFKGPWLTRYQEARQLAKAGRISQAAERWLEMARTIPERRAWLPAWLNYHAARVLTDHRLWKQADKAYAEAVREAQNDLDLLAPMHRSWGWTLWESGEWDKADEHYRAMVSQLGQADRNLASAEFLTILGENANIRGKLIQAREYFRTALAINEQFAPSSGSMNLILFSLGDIDFQLGELDEAERKLRAVVDRTVVSDFEKAASLVDLAKRGGCPS